MPGVTKEQIQAAREADLFAWLQSHEPGVLKRDGPNYRHKEHDSLVYVTGKRYWYWNSRGRSINALDYLIQIRGYGLVDAVQALAGGEIRQTPAYQSAAAKQAQREPEKKPFTLPWARRCATAAVSYLQRRGISSDVISRCFRNGLFYEARYHGEPVCVFVGKDNAGKAKFACMRGITGNLKKDVYGSDKEFSFCYPPQNPGSRHVAVFEAPIDALSHATLQELEGWKWNGYRLSLGGTSHVALTAFLERHPEIKRVTLYMDNDLGGLTNARKIKAMLHEDQRFKHKLPYASDYLAGHADCAVALVMDKSGETEVLKAYPQGEERRAINAVFDEIVADLKLQHTLTHAETTLPLAVQAVPLAENEQITIFTMERPSVIGQLAAARSAEKSTPAQAAPKKSHAPEI